MNIGRSICLVSLLIIYSQFQICDAKTVPPTPYVTPLTDVIHSCRQKCISEILGELKWSGQLMMYFRCRGKPNCFMCWDYCRAVSVAKVDLAQSMCNDRQYCLKGCSIACNFYQTNAMYGLIVN